MKDSPPETKNNWQLSVLVDFRNAFGASLIFNHKTDRKIYLFFNK